MKQVLIIILALCFAGCAQVSSVMSEVSSQSEVAADNSTTKKFPMKDGFPIWFSNPNYNGYIGGVGVAKSQVGGVAVQRRVATTLAQADLIKNVRVTVDNELTTEKTSTNNVYIEKLTSMSRQTAEDYVRNPQVMDEWIDPATNELYIWVTLK